VSGAFSRVKACGLAFGVAVERGKQVGLDGSREFLGLFLGCFDLGLHGCSDCLDGAVERFLQVLSGDGLVGFFHGRLPLLW